MVLSKNKRLAIIILVLCVAAGGAIFNTIATEIEAGAIDINVKESYFFKTDHYATYVLRNESSGIDSILLVKGKVINSTHTEVTLSINGSTIDKFFVNPEGFIYLNGELQQNIYSIWWVFVKNVFMMLGVKEGDTYNLCDVSGFIGPVAENYSMIVTERMVLWPHDPIQKNLSGAQSSFRVSIFREPSHEKIGTSILDVTCGVIEVWDGLINGTLGTLILIDTSFPISRNRNIVLAFDAIFGCVLIILVGLIIFGKIKMGKKKEGEKSSKFLMESSERKEFLWLLSTGVGMVIVEVIDIWFYMYLGRDGCLHLHLGIFVLFLIMGKILNYGYKYAIPAFLEIAFVFALGFFTGDAYVPSLTANIGSLIAWLAFIWASGVEKKVDEDLRGFGRIISEII
ncbi:MAG: hypothetical protein ACTSRZ_07555 [Promethearchaeota archaeon]